MEFQEIGFIGFGLIGGSIAKKLKKDHPQVRIYATARHPETIEAAFAEHLTENRECLPLSAFAGCDCIFLCAPVQLNISYLRELKNIIKEDCLITDVGSTKTEIHKEAAALGLEKNFIGGHPMTGSEKTGIRNASEYLLENAYYIITPTAQSNPETVRRFADFVRSLGSIPLVLNYEAHDYATASISHLPHMIAFSLVNLIKEIDDENETMKTIAAGGFKDITRIASSSPVMWENICMSNRAQILKLLDLYTDKLTELRRDIEAADRAAVTDFFQSAKDYRDSFSMPSVHSPTNIYEIYLDLVDEAGEIATIATILAFKGISIKNIGIINNREFEEGVLRIEFYDQKALDLSVRLLKERNYTVHTR